MLSCFGIGKDRGEEREREPLLPVYSDDTGLQTRLHEKLHTYQMLRAISKGYMPSNEQTIIHLRSLLSSDVLNPNTSELSDSGRALVRSARLWIKQFIGVLQHKNSEDQVQDFVWFLAKSRLDVDVADLGARASKAKVKADTAATYRSLQTVGSLLLSNSDFRIFLSDLGTVGKEVFRDTAFTLADASKKAGQQIQPSESEQEALKNVDGGTTQTVPSTEDLKDEVADVAHAVSDATGEVVAEAEHSVADHLQGEEQEALVQRLKQTVLQLRKRTDYSESVSTLSLLLRRYLLAYSHAASDTMHAVEEDIDVNPEADKALQNFWLLVTSFGDKESWKQVEKSFQDVVDDGKTDPKFDELVRRLANLVQDMLTDPEFFDNAERRFQELRAKSKELVGGSSVADHVDALLGNLQAALRSVVQDKDIHSLTRTSARIAQLLSPTGQYTNGELVTDSINVFVPMLVQGIQYIPIPRIEVATPAIDLLLENLILQPGRTVNHSSFLPYRLNVSTHNDVEVRKARFRTTSTMTSLLTVKISGLSFAADDLGYWLKLHSGLLRMMDEGLAGFHLDERGIDVTLDIEIGRERMEKIVSLRNVDVKIHHLNYTLTKSKFACIAWLLKPLIRPIVRKALEIKVAGAIADGLHTLNRELLYARERLRATRIADPGDLWTYLKAVAARLTPAPDPDLETRVGVQPGSGVFRGRYAPGSLVKLWDQEARGTEQTVFEYERGGWRNEIFDVRTTLAS